MRFLGRGVVAFVLIVVLIGGLLISSMVVSLSGGSPAAAAPGDCVPVAPGNLAAGAMPAAYAADVAAAAAASGLPAPMLAAQLEAESGWNPRAVSPVGARGIAQFMPATWEHWAPGKDPFDPHAGITAQGKYMGELYRQAKDAGYPGDAVDLAFAGYNAGWGSVEAAGGMPNFPETRNYVIRIRQLAAKYTDPAAPIGPSPALAAGPGGGCDVGVAAPGAGDDYPFRNLPHCTMDAVGNYTGCPDGSQSQFGSYNRECTDFVMWRMNQQLGSTQAPWKVTNANFRTHGGVLGNASMYLSAWENKGWPTGTTPQVGAVVFYAAGHPLTGAQSLGHVAIVKAILPGGKFLEEGYNFGYPPTDHNYYTAVRADNIPSKFLYIPKP